mgnify:CR=1 FL=1
MTEPLYSIEEGSSPLARGTLESVLNVFQGLRLIPARAGNTASAPASPAHARAHPRSRGEHPRTWAVTDDLKGSSPLARGAPIKLDNCQATVGLIPARAGSTVCQVCLFLVPGAHPRSRGEHSVSGWMGRYDGGSSPLARGALAEHRQAKAALGLIPARAGSTTKTLRLSTQMRAHPRSRGEHNTRHRITILISGSSPLARGAHS